jgi:uncharacterized protein YybS (DUF2232 family)
MKMKDVLGCVGWAAFLLLASAWIPFIGPFLSLLTPLPFLYYSTKLGFYRGVKLTALVIITVAFVAKLAGYAHIFPFGMEFSLLGLVLSELFRRKFSMEQTLFLGTMFMLLLCFGILFFFALSKNMGPFEMMLDYLKSQLDVALKTYREAGIQPEKAVELEAFAKSFMNTISIIYPSLIVIGTGFAVWLNVVMAKPLFRMGNLEYPDFGAMDHWRSPDGLIWGVIFAGFALFLSSGSIKSIAINAMIIMVAIYLFQGLSILLFFLNKYHVPSWIRAGIYFFLVIQQLLWILLILAGLFDQWIDIRKIRRTRDSI